MGTTTSFDRDLSAALHERGQRVTPQRLAIHRAVRELDRHLSAEEVYAAVETRLPGVSLPTVYATLELLEDLGFVRRVAAARGSVLYDPRTMPHHHLACRRCGTVEDLDAPVDAERALRAARRHGFAPEHTALTISGLCSRCAGD